MLQQLEMKNQLIIDSQKNCKKENRNGLCDMVIISFMEEKREKIPSFIS